MKIKIRNRTMKVYGEGNKVLHKVVKFENNRAAISAKRIIEENPEGFTFKPQFEALDGLISVDFTEEYIDCLSFGATLSDNF